jgi:hypothetical protein
MAQAAERALTGPEWPGLRANLDTQFAEARAARRRHDITAFDVTIDTAVTLRATVIELADILIYALDIDAKRSEYDAHS